MKKCVIALACILLAIMPAGCGTGQQVKQKGPFVYYVNPNGTALEKSKYKKVSDSSEKEIENMLKKLKNAQESIEFKSAIPEDVQIERFELKKNKLSLYFNQAYMKMGVVEEVLCRSAVVQSLAQISGVEFIEFYVDNVPLNDADGKLIGPMRKEDFIQNTGSEINSYQVTTLTLYFSNKSGDKLVKETVNVRYNSNLSIEKLIVEQLMKGPSGEKAVKTISPEAKLLGISVKDGICYVNFDEGFMNNNFDLDPNIQIYSIVNSIVEGGTVNQVQISIAGETKVMFKGSVKLDEPFTKDMKLVEETK